MKLILFHLSLISFTLCMMKPPRILQQYSYSEEPFSQTKTYTYGDITFLGSDRYFCFDKEKCSGESNSPANSNGWKKLGPNEAVDLSQDNYVSDRDYILTEKIIYHQINWTCKDAGKCSSGNYNPVGIYGEMAWDRGLPNNSTLKDDSASSTE